MGNITSADVRRYNSKLVDRIKEAATPSPLAVALTPDDGLNKTERAYRDLLDLRQMRGEIKGYWTHKITLKLGEDCRYTCDFVVQENDGTLTFVEIKGWLRDDALVKFRAAQAMFPIFRFIMVQRCKQSQGGWKTIRE